MNNTNFVDLSGGQAVYNRMEHSGERFKRKKRSREKKNQVLSYCFKIKIADAKTTQMYPFMYFVILQSLIQNIFIFYLILQIM